MLDKGADAGEFMKDDCEFVNRGLGNAGWGEGRDGRGLSRVNHLAVKKTKTALRTKTPWSRPIIVSPS